LFVTKKKNPLIA